MVRATVTENVWSFDGRRVLIPAGSRLIGEYNRNWVQDRHVSSSSGRDCGRTASPVTRVRTAPTISAGPGNAGFVDNHYVERFGAAIMLSIAAAPRNS